MASAGPIGSLYLFFLLLKDTQIMVKPIFFNFSIIKFVKVAPLFNSNL